MNPRKIINQWWFCAPFLAWAIYLLLPRCHGWWVGRTETFRGTVLGTFSGILVALVAFLVSKYHEMRLKRCNALSYMEQILTCLFTNIGDNQWQIEKALGVDEVTLIFPSELKIAEQDIREIGRIDLKNKLFGVVMDCQKYNLNLAGAIKLFETNVDTFKTFSGQQASGNVVEASLKAFYRQFKIQLKELHDFGKVTEIAIEGALVDTRFFIKNDKLWFVSLNPYYNKHDLEPWRKADGERLRREREEIAAADDARRKKNEAIT